MPDLPSGTVTFVFSDLEGSTALLKRLGDAGYAEMLGVHRRLLRDTFNAHGGNEIDTQGDAFFYSFPRARGAVAAAVELQRKHAEQEWPGGGRVNVRLGLHTGEPIVGEEGYTGLDVVRAARIAADGKGGQILLSEATRAIVGDDLPEGVGVRELGERTLKDIDKPEPLYELVYGAPEANEPSVAPAAPVPAEPEQAWPFGPVGKPVGIPDSVSVDVAPKSIRGWLDVARKAIREGDDFDPGPLIEQRVLQQIDENMKRSDERHAQKQGRKQGSSPPGAPAPSKKSVADELERLRTLRDQGALSDEQYSKAVDRVLAEG